MCPAEAASGVPGTDDGLTSSVIPTSASNAVTDQFAAMRDGNSFSTAISAAMNAIQPMLITPSANSAAISAQQQPTHQAPCTAPIRNAPYRLGRQFSITNITGPLQRVRQAFFAGVTW